MKLLSPALLVLTLAACAKAPQEVAQPAPAESAPHEIVLQFPGHENAPVTLLEFVQACQKASGWNFTYTQETDEALRARSVQVFGEKRIASGEFQGFLEVLFSTNGFECKPVGPERLHVLLISPKKT